MTLTLQFILMIDTKLSVGELIFKLVSYYPHHKKYKNNFYIIKQNFIKVFNNEDSDFTLSLNEDEGYLYYPVKLEATPLDGKITEDDQIKFVQDMVGLLRSHECKIVVCANFEDKIT